MKTLFAELRSALLATLVLAVVCCGLYPFVVFGFGQLAFRDNANGSLFVDKHGAVRGSQRLGQAFTGARYFRTRPSAAGSGCDAASSGGSNLGPTSKKLRVVIENRIQTYRKENGLKDTDFVPADAVTASGSGLDPHISPESARLQIARVAAARGLAPTAVAECVEKALEHPQWGLLGAPRVNVFRLNLALDEMNISR